MGREPEIITSKDKMRRWSRAMRAQGKAIGLVPTMGYLHKGHLALVNEARQHAQLIVVSIYVNPGQFSTSEDLSTYPSDFNGDLQKLMSVPGGVDVVFNPHDLYDYGSWRGTEGMEKKEDVGEVSCLEEKGGGHETWVRVEKLEKGLCGKSRPLFFRGVATVVSKLFNIVEPDVAVFGKKDYQQWRIIRRMVSRLHFCFASTSILVCELFSVLLRLCFFDFSQHVIVVVVMLIMAVVFLSFFCHIIFYDVPYLAC